MKILWFSKTKGTSSFSRITRSILRYLTIDHDITLLSDEKIQRCDNKKDILKYINILQDTSSISFEEFKRLWTMRKSGSENLLEMNMKYVVTQLIDEIYESNNYDLLVLLNGIYEVDWYSERIIECFDMIKAKYPEIKLPKLMIWTPIDYKPSKEIVKNIIKADILVTMTPVMSKIIKQKYNKQTYTLGHGCDIADSGKDGDDKNSDISDLAAIITSNPKLNDTDIIILNANDYVQRKQIKKTVEAFLELLSVSEDNVKSRLKLWLHTNIIKLLSDKEGPINLISQNRKYIVLTNNNIHSSDLHKIYSRCQISLQTSTGEGFSMTNIEHACLGGLQVVPNFLATGYHFSNKKGILIDIKEEKSVSENGFDTIVCYMEINSIVESLKNAVNMVYNNTKEYNDMITLSTNYSKSISWKYISKEFNNILDQTTCSLSN